MAKLILFSGGCNSGKTTTLKAVAKKLGDSYHKVHILDELIRKETDKPIDELRKDANAYLELQNKIIRAKIQQEKTAIEDFSDDVYLADRAVTDSMFYLENYVDKSQLDEHHIELLCKLHESIDEYLTRYFWRYHLVVEFKPIIVKESDLFRPHRVDILKDYEHRCISHLNYVYSNGYRRKEPLIIDLNYMRADEVVETIIKKADL